MKVMTEELLRQKWRKKELLSGTELVIDLGMVVTPAAKSFLQEHHITWRVSAVGENQQQEEKLKKEPRTQLSSEVESEQPKISRELLRAIKKLKNLFYFPLLADDFFSGETWLFIEQQQQWLAGFEQSLMDSKGDLALVITQNPAVILGNNNRSWAYVRGELLLFFEDINYLLEKEQVATASRLKFFQWVQEMLKFFKLAQVEGGQSDDRLRNVSH